MSENNLQIFYYPVSTYKVLPVTRSSASLMGHTDSVICSAFSPDSSMLATGSGDTTVRLWDIQTQTPYK
jgi:ribosome assembly protein 4